MKIIDYFILELFLTKLLLCSFGLSLFFSFQSLFPELIEHQYPISQLLYFHWLNSAHVCVEMFPPAVLMAVVLTLGQLSRSFELVALYSIGVGLRSILSRILTVVFLACCLILLLQDRVLPIIYKKKTSFYWNVIREKPDFFLDLKRDKIWYRSKNMIYNLQRFDPKSQLIYGMSIYTFDQNFHLTEVVASEKAQFEKGGWTLLNGNITVFSDENIFPLSQSFKAKHIVLAENPTDFQEIEKEVDSLSFRQLSNYIKKMKQVGADTKIYDVKFHSRLSTSFISIIMALIAIPFSTSNRRDGGYARSLLLCFGITFSYWLFYSIGLSLGNKGSLSPVLAAWLPTVVFSIFGVGLGLRKVQ